MNLFEEITEHLSDPRMSAIVMEAELDPVQGPRAPICPSTYAGDSTDKSRTPHFALTDESFVPTQNESGWYHGLAPGPDGPRLAPRVVVNSTGASAEGAESALYLHQPRLGLKLPAIILDGRLVAEAMTQKVIATARANAMQAAQIRQALHVVVSSWELAHRTADSWLQYADDGTGKQVWGNDTSALKEILLNISHERGELTYAYAPNVGVFGNWLSAGTARRHAIPRAYSCETTGYGARSVVRGVTKLDRVGGATNAGRKLKADGQALALGKVGKPPADFGFGQVPGQPWVRAFECELILRRASVSLKAFDRFRYPADDDRRRAFAAKRVYCLLAMAGHVLASEDGFLRSGCDLLLVEERWGLRRHGERHPIAITVPTVEDFAQALGRAVAEAAEAGLEFAEPTTCTFSELQVGMIVDRVMNEVKATVDSDAAS